MCTERDFEKQSSPELFHAGENTIPELFLVVDKKNPELFHVEKQASPELFHAGEKTNPELFQVAEKTRPWKLSWIGCCLLRGIWRADHPWKVLPGRWRAGQHRNISCWKPGQPWKVLPGMLKSRIALKYFLLESRPALKSPTWDVDEQARSEIFLVGKQASPEKIDLGC
jgi:hypothetical protein